MSVTKLYRGPADMPETVPVFPLSGALLLPRGEMPLNIFEPRYLAMVDDALARDRMIGMIQPRPESAHEKKPALHTVGCVGRITQLAETGDGRYILTLTGITRFDVVEEVLLGTSYRNCRISSERFAGDFVADLGEERVNRDGVLDTLRKFAALNKLKVDWDSVKSAPNEALVNALAMMSPFGPPEKQALLEAMDIANRADVLIAISEMEIAKSNRSSNSLQ